MELTASLFLPNIFQKSNTKYSLPHCCSFFVRSMFSLTIVDQPVGKQPFNFLYCLSAFMKDRIDYLKEKRRNETHIAAPCPSSSSTELILLLILTFPAHPFTPEKLSKMFNQTKLITDTCSSI